LNSIRKEITQNLSAKKADVGVSIMGIEDKDTLSINGKRHYPMQSVFKFHIALVVLAEVDKGNLSLTQKITIRKSDLTTGTWSPIERKYPEGSELTLAEILKYTVAESDNVGCDILLRLIGGPGIVNRYFATNNFEDISIKANEEEMHKDWNVQFSNWTTTNSTVSLLKAFFDQKLLSATSNNFLLKTMIETSTGKMRIKGQLPESTIVAHKTGTSGTNEIGVSAALNDIGIVTLPNGKHFLISIFVSDSYENEETNEKIISDIAKLTWNYYMNKAK
jgi:beta-lactamase class A